MQHDAEKEPKAPSWPHQQTTQENDYHVHQTSGRDTRSTQSTTWGSSGTPSDYNDPPRYQSFGQSQSNENNDSLRCARGSAYQPSDPERGSWQQHQGGNNLGPWESMTATCTDQGESSNTYRGLYSYNARDENEIGYRFQRTNDYDPETESSIPPQTAATQPS